MANIFERKSKTYTQVGAVIMGFLSPISKPKYGIRQGVLSLHCYLEELLKDYLQ